MKLHLVDCDLVIKLTFVCRKMYVNALIGIEPVEILRKVKRKLVKVRTGLVSDDTYSRYSELLGTAVSVRQDVC